MASTQLDFMISIIGVLITGLTAYDTQKIKHVLSSDNETAGKKSVME